MPEVIDSSNITNPKYRYIYLYLFRSRCMAIQISPGINVSEIDLTTSVPAVSTSVGAFAGTFAWGPVLAVTAISNQVQLVSKFSEPDTNTATSFFTAANFLSYASALFVVRNSSTGQLNASANGSGVLINNEGAYFNTWYTTAQASCSSVARYPGRIGSSLKV